MTWEIILECEDKTVTLTVTSNMDEIEGLVRVLAPLTKVYGICIRKTDLTDDWRSRE